MVYVEVGLLDIRGCVSAKRLCVCLEGEVFGGIAYARRGRRERQVWGSRRGMWWRGPAGGTGAPAAGAAPTFSAFHPRMLVNQRPLYSRLSMSNERVTSSPGLRMNWSARSPKKSKWTFLGKLSCVSRTYSRFFQGLPALDVPVISGRASMILPWISMC